MKLVTDTIDCITSNGVKTSGEEHELDTLIFATGFDPLKSMNSYRVVGVGGRDLGQEMGDTPAAMNGIVVVRTMICQFILYSSIS